MAKECPDCCKLADTFGAEDLVMRELMPRDLNFDLDRLTREKAIAGPRYLAGAIGKADGADRLSASSQVSKFNCELNVVRLFNGRPD